MLGAVWGRTPFGEKLRRELEETFPDFPAEPSSIRAAVVANVEAPVDKQMLFALSDSIENAVHAMGVERVAVVPVGAQEIQDRLGIQVRGGER
jgi:elongation factor P--beta-lysine ligase